MSEIRYSELKYDGKIYTEQWKIDEILIDNKFNWMVDAEIKNARLEIFQDTLVWNAGIWYNGNWYFGVWRDGEWRYGTWQNGVFYNGVWRNGTFKSGIIFNGKFFKGKIESGEIRGGQFIDTEISPNVKEYTGDEFAAQQQEQQKTAVAQAQPEQPNQNKVRVHFTSPTQEIESQPKIQKEKKEYKNMKRIKTFETFLTEEKPYETFLDTYSEDELELYEWDEETLLELRPRILKLNPLWSKKSEEERVKFLLNAGVGISEKEAYEIVDDDIGGLPLEILSDWLIDEIEEWLYQGETNESVGELEDSFVDINIDETELEDSDRPNLGKLKQKAGIEIIETPSKTDAYNAKMRKGGEVIQEPGFSDKQLHHVKSINDLK